MKHIILSVVVLSMLAGCGLFPGRGEVRRAPITAPADTTGAAAAAGAESSMTAALGARSARAEELDTTTEAERQAALEAPAARGERELGRVVVALGPPAEQGIWLKTTLVTEVVQGRVETAAGQSLGVELRPGTGGALLSLAAFQALGLPLTELPEVAVFAP